MSNFQCLVCKTNIIKDENGNYITQCKHYQFEKTNKGKKGAFNDLFGLFDILPRKEK